MSYRSAFLATSATLVVTLSAALAPSAASAQPADGAPVMAQQATRVAVLDTRRVIMETEEGLRVQANLRKLFESRQVDLSTKERQLQQEYEELQKEEKQKGKAQDLERRKGDWKLKYGQLQQTLGEYQREMQRKEGEFTGPMLNKIGAIVKTLAGKDGHDIVIEKQAATYFRSDLEITDKVIQLFNAGDSAAQKPAPKKPAAAPKTPAAGPTKKP